jgi:hypothetical protein
VRQGCGPGHENAVMKMSGGAQGMDVCALLGLWSRDWVGVFSLGHGVLALTREPPHSLISRPMWGCNDCWVFAWVEWLGFSSRWRVRLYAAVGVGGPRRTTYKRRVLPLTLKRSSHTSREMKNYTKDVEVGLWI